MPVLHELRDRLVALGVGVSGSNIFLGSKAAIPTGDGPYLSLIETGGSGSASTHNNTAVSRPTVQILCRAKGYDTARSKLKQAYDALGGDVGLHNIVLSGTYYQHLKARQQPTDIGLDSETRPMIVFNVDIEKNPS